MSAGLSWGSAGGKLPRVEADLRGGREDTAGRAAGAGFGGTAVEEVADCRGGGNLECLGAMVAPRAVDLPRVTGLPME